MEYFYNDARAKIICKMEQILARNVTTTSYTNGKYRYPVHYKQNNKSWVAKGLANVEYDNIPTMYYEFGAHRVDIGNALMEMLEFLEEINDGQNYDAFDYYDDGIE